MAGQANSRVRSSSAGASGSGSHARTSIPRRAKCDAHPHPITPIPMHATTGAEGSPEIGAPGVSAKA